MIQAINTEQRQLVITNTHTFIERARQYYDRDFELIPISFDLKGRAAGMYKVAGQRRLIRYNPYIFARYFEQNISVTIPHEVAHYVADTLYGTGPRWSLRAYRIRPHGQEWQSVMRDFGVDASRTCNFDMVGLPQRRYKYYSYSCDCRQHQLGSRRHMRVVRQQAHYHCRSCGGKLQQT